MVALVQDSRHCVGLKCGEETWPLPSACEGLSCHLRSLDFVLMAEQRPLTCFEKGRGLVKTVSERSLWLQGKGLQLREPQNLIKRQTEAKHKVGFLI